MAALVSSCCSVLAACPSLHIVYPNSAGYNLTEASYWSLQESSLEPSCVVKPSTAIQAADAITILVTDSACQSIDFAIKAQGHAPAAGFANIDRGVTIDITSIDSITTNHNASVAYVGAGASWLDVYAALDPFGKAVAGGRNGAVGVGGLTLGGGISYFSPQVGFTCDTVLNFEVVLASGRLVNANATSRPDLFRALKGGTNNFGLVTRFDFATVPTSQILAGSIVYNLTERQAVFDAFANIASASDYDVHASVVVGILFNSSSKAWTVTSTPIYTAPVSEPPIYEELFAVPSIVDTVKLVDLAKYSNESATPPLNWLFYTGTYGVSANLLGDIFDIVNETAYDFDPAPWILWDLAFEPLPTVFVSHGAGTNSLGTSAADGNSMILLLSALWLDPTQNAAVHAKAAQIMARINARAKKAGLLKRFVYTNYADWSQDPLQSYGIGEVERLRRTAKRCDPRSIFGKRVPGGFKIPA